MKWSKKFEFNIESAKNKELAIIYVVGLFPCIPVEVAIHEVLK